MRPRLILASASPRRRALLDQIGVSYRVRPAEIDETPLATEPPDQYVLRVAQAKASAIRLANDNALPILGADTAVVLDNTILGKPRGSREGVEMLRRLSGRWHQVISAVHLNLGMGTTGLEAVSISRVHFRRLEEHEILAYWKTGEPLDKAGGYAVQGRGAIFVKSLEGSFSGVMGLPLYETAELLKEAGIEIL